MAYQFQQPGFVKPQDWSGLTKSIDALFNAYAQGKLERQQYEAGQTQLQSAQTQAESALAAFRLANGGLSPQEVNRFMPQAQQPQGQVPVVPTPLQPQQQPLYSQPQQNPGPWAPQPQQVGQGIGQQPPAMQPAYEDPRVGTVRAILAMHQQGLQMGAQKAQADLSKSQGEARTSNVEADILGAPLLPGQQGQQPASGGNVVQNVLNAVQSGQMSPNQADDYLGRNPKVHLAYINALAKQGVDVASLQNAFDKKKATANFEGGQNVQEPARLVKSIKAGLPGLIDAADKAGMGDTPLWNGIKLKYDQAVRGTEGSQSYITQIGELRAQVAQVLQAHGAPADSAVQRAEHMLPDNIGKKQLRKVVDQDIPELIGARADALEGKPVTPRASAQQAKENSVPAEAASIIKAGLSKGLSREAIKAQLKAAGH